jgi:mycothiol synthase
MTRTSSRIWQMRSMTRDYEDARQEIAMSAVYDPSPLVRRLDSDEAVGALFGYMTNGRGQISALAVRDSWRRRVIAQALLPAGFVRFRERGVDDVRLNVDRGNVFGASHLYERAGMHLRRRWFVVAKTMTAERFGVVVIP